MLDFNECIKVGIADYKIGSNPDKLVTLGLGSCVGICIYDVLKKTGALVHVLLPSKNGYILKCDKDLKYADIALPLAIEELIDKGCKIRHMRAVIVGGGNMFKNENRSLSESIGYKNQESVRKILKSYNIEVVCDDTGGNVGKTVFFDTCTGNVYVKTGLDINMIYEGYK